MKILVVGDLHGDWGKLNKLITKKRPDIVLQTGDWGYWPMLSSMKPVLYGKQKSWDVHGQKTNGTVIYFCDGNHEDHGVLSQLGVPLMVSKGVFHGSRGSTITLPDNRVVLFCGGAASIDKDSRTPGLDWFPEENISVSQLDSMLSHKRVDIVISHTCPTRFRMNHEEKVQDSNRYALDVVLEHYSPDLWYFGHWHQGMKGKYNGCSWTALDYPGHGGRWWDWLPDVKVPRIGEPRGEWYDKI